MPGEQHDPAGDRVFRQVRVGPLVDVVGVAIPPVLEELGRRAGVVDLVEVHLVRLGEPEHPDAEDRREEHDEDPQIEKTFDPGPIPPAGEESFHVGEDDGGIELTADLDGLDLEGLDLNRRKLSLQDLYPPGGRGIVPSRKRRWGGLDAS